MACCRRYQMCQSSQKSRFSSTRGSNDCYKLVFERLKADIFEYVLRSKCKPKPLASKFRCILGRRRLPAYEVRYQPAIPETERAIKRPYTPFHRANAYDGSATSPNRCARQHWFTTLISSVKHFVNRENGLALVGYEWLIVLGILLVVFLWGPQKLPELAKSIGLAKKEFEKAAKEASISTSPSPAGPTTSSPTSPPSDPLIVAARSVGITTEGKTKEQIAKEIADKTPTN